jgi:hypothetical protein
MKGHIPKARLGEAHDALAEMGINAEVRHVPLGTGFEVVTTGMPRKERLRVQQRLTELGLLMNQSESEAE